MKTNWRGLIVTGAVCFVIALAATLVDYDMEQGPHNIYVYVENQTRYTFTSYALARKAPAEPWENAETDLFTWGYSFQGSTADCRLDFFSEEVQVPSVAFTVTPNTVDHIAVCLREDGHGGVYPTLLN